MDTYTVACVVFIACFVATMWSAIGILHILVCNPQHRWWTTLFLGTVVWLVILFYRVTKGEWL